VQKVDNNPSTQTDTAIVIHLSLSCKNSNITERFKSGFKVSGFKVSGFRVSGFRVSGFRVSGFKVSGFRVSGSSNDILNLKP
jgi:hypothetical protein